MNFKIIFFVTAIFISCTYGNTDKYIPEALYKRRGGMSIRRKELLFGIGDRQDVYIGPNYPNFLPTLDNLKTVAVCEGKQADNGKSFDYFVCPIVKDQENKIFCCGAKGSQKCCTKDDFIASIYVMEDTNLASTSTILGIVLGLLNSIFLCALIFHCLYVRRQKNARNMKYQMPLSAIPPISGSRSNLSAATDPHHITTRSNMTTSQSRQQPSVLSTPTVQSQHNVSRPMKRPY